MHYLPDPGPGTTQVSFRLVGTTHTLRFATLSSPRPYDTKALSSLHTSVVLASDELCSIASFAFRSIVSNAVSMACRAAAWESLFSQTIAIEKQARMVARATRNAHDHAHSLTQTSLML